MRYAGEMRKGFRLPWEVSVAYCRVFAQRGPELLPCGGCSFRAVLGEVCSTRSHRELAHAGSFCCHLYAAESGLAGWLIGVVADGVLTADISGHLCGNLIHLLDILWKKCDAARLCRKHIQRAPRMPDLCSAHLVPEKQPDGVDNWTRQFLDPPNGLLQRQRRCIVLAVRDDHHHLLGPLPV